MDELERFGMDLEDALLYIFKVESRFLDQPQVYDEFIRILNGALYQRTDILKTIPLICNLFRGHPDLIADFEYFLPSDITIKIHGSEKLPVSSSSTDLGVGVTSSQASSSSTTTTRTRPRRSPRLNPPNPATSPHSSSGSTVKKFDPRS